jgi:hypothetical protein
MERYCGSLVPAIQSRRFPFPSIDRYVTEVAQLTQIKTYHRLHDTLSLQAPKLNVAGMFSSRACTHRLGYRKERDLMPHLQIHPVYYFLLVTEEVSLPSLWTKS